MALLVTVVVSVASAASALDFSLATAAEATEDKLDIVVDSSMSVAMTFFISRRVSNASPAPPTSAVIAASALDFSVITAMVLAEILIEFRISAASALDFSVAMDVVLASALSAFASAK